MRLQSCFITHVILIIPVLVLITPGKGEAVSRVSGKFSLERVFASGQTESPGVLTGGVDLEIIPATRKFRTRLIIPLQFTLVSGETAVQAFPVGNFGTDITGDVYTINLQYGRFATVSNTAQLTEVTNSRIAFSLFPPELPRLNASLFRTDVDQGGRTSRADSVTFSSNYQYKWLNFRGGASLSELTVSDSPPVSSSSVFFGTGGSYEVLPRTTVFGKYDFNRSATDTTTGVSTSIKNTFGAGFDSRPIEWLGLGGNFTRSITTHESGPDDHQESMGINARLFLPGKLQISPSIESNSFDDQGKQRDVTSYTLAASYTEQLIEKVLLGVTASRSYDHDPKQGTNVRDSFGLNTVMDVTPRVSVRLNLSVTRQEDRLFVVEKSFDASGTLAERAVFDDRPAGFIFFDSVNSDLYTKNSAVIGDWSLPVHVDPPVTEQFNFIKSIQLNMIPTDKTNLILSYSVNSSSDGFDFADTGSQIVIGSFSYIPKRSTRFSLFGNASLPETGVATYSGTVSVSHTLKRGPQLNVSYGWQSQGQALNSFSTIFSIPFRKRVSLDLSYSAAQFLKDDQTYVFKVRLTKSF